MSLQFHASVCSRGGRHLDNPVPHAQLDLDLH